MAPKLLLTPTDRALLADARRATLATIAPDGMPRLVPICFAVHATDAALYSALDEKPKRTADPHALARVRDVAADPRVSILVDRWDEDWTRLAWLRCLGLATLLEPGAADDEHRRAIEALRDRYPAYRRHDLESRPVLRIAIERIVRWAASGHVRWGDL
jgi:PPOX class probable F420-dependent enzyme